jgi:MurNAc alpha-1-phosphate uridylyltransferase
MSMRAMILAAGRGERMRELTATRPKPLLEVAGRSLIERHIERLAAAAVSHIVINLAYGGAAIRDALGDGSRWKLRIDYSDEGSDALETGGGIIQALPLLGSAPFIVVSADVLTDFPYADFVSGAIAANTLVLVDNPEHHPLGDFALTPRGLLGTGRSALTYAGIALLDPGLFSGWPAGRLALRPIFEAAMRRGGLRGVHHRGLWLDVGTPERLAAARALLGGGC